MQPNTSIEGTFWNGEPCQARKVTVIVVDHPEADGYWARQLVGQRREAVEVIYGGETFYLDDGEFDPDPDSDYVRVIREFGHEPHGHHAGLGWQKVTEGRGSPQWSSYSLSIEPGSVEAR